MPSTAIIDVAIGVAFVYLFFSLVCSVVNEIIASAFALRSKNLVAAIDSLFSKSTLPDGKPFVQAIYENGLIRAFFKDPQKSVAGPADASATDPPAAGPLLRIPSVLRLINNKLNVNLPAYIPARAFSSALLDVVLPPVGGVPRSLDEVRKAVLSLPPGPTKDALLSLLSSTQTDVSEFQDKVEKWFNDSMDRAAGWYKRSAQRILLALGIVVALGMNVDTIRIAESLWTNPAAQQATAELAKEYVQAHPAADSNAPASSSDPEQQAKSLAQLGSKLPVPFGWRWEVKASPAPFCSPFSNLYFWLLKLLGCMITALALSLGAPFWFDTLNKFMSVRTSVKPADGKAKA